MHDTSIREEDPERDIGGIVELIRESEPTAVVSAASWQQRIDSVPARARDRAWVAEEDGVIVGNAYAFLSFFTEGSTAARCHVVVRGSHRRRGIGSALHALVEEHADAIGGTSLVALFEENAAGVAFVSGLGYRAGRAETVSTLDPRAVAEATSAAVDLRPLSEIDPRLAYEVDAAASLDIPSSEPIDYVPYDDWVEHVLAYPLFSAAGSYVAFVDGRPAAVSLLAVDPEIGRASNLMTGTVREHRGRGLARAVKLASIRWAAEQGVTAMITTNDEQNAPMLAVNRSLGYRPAGRRVEWVR